ncbi:carbon-nitrogen hydrolase [Multifurca ochricompacta]|uniref:Carbon-nitrogen hydrolase n=1 Tax=Multifurca ochricompacta TaxID=376703 RepID=A0AAD4QPQ8_9AGAM|nr:carbon-nitrogen hydrolase [Multifurca ochricompacta]
MSSFPPPPAFKPFNLALIQLGQIGPDKAANLKHARDMIRKAANGEGEGAQGKPDLIVLPRWAKDRFVTLQECFNSPYGHTHFPVYAEPIEFKSGGKYNIEASQSESVKMLSEAAKSEGVWLLGGSIPERDPSNGNIYNTSTVYSPQGELVVTHRKVHLFDIDIPGKITFKESETLTGGSTTNFFDTEFARVGLGICYDVRFPELAMISARQGCQVLIYPGAFNTTTGPLHWELLQRARAIDNQVYFSMCSPARDLTAGYHAWGHSLVVDPMGSKLVEAEDGETILHTRINPKTFNDARAGIPVTTQRRFDVYLDVSKGS